MTVRLTTLMRDMDALALRTWEKIELSEKVNLRYGEETITDDNLLTLALKHRDLLVHRYTQNREHHTGADWEWWIGSDETGWLCLRIQAKKVKRSTYPELTHDGAVGDEYQYDTLIRSCDPLKGVHPLHVFYNGWAKGAFAPNTYWAEPAVWRACPDGDRPDACSHVTPRHYGCAIASSFSVKRVVESRTPADRTVVSHLSNALPWSYLLGLLGREPRPGHFLSSAGDKLTQTTATEFSLEAWMTGIQATCEVLLADEPPAGNGQWGEIAQSVNPQNRRFRLPEYVEAIRARDSSDFTMLTASELPAAPLTIVLDKTPRRRRSPTNIYYHT